MLQQFGHAVSECIPIRYLRRCRLKCIDGLVGSVVDLDDRLLWADGGKQPVEFRIGLQDRRPEGYPYVFVPPGRYDHIQRELRPKGKWTLLSAKDNVINNFTRQFKKILTKAHVDAGTFHDIRKTAITNWFRKGLSEYDVMKLAGHSDFVTTHRFYLAVADDLVARAREAITHRVSPKLLEKCCKCNPKDVGRVSKNGANWCSK